MDRLISRSQPPATATAAAAWQVLAVLDVEAGEGLPHREAWARLLACGENTLRPEHAPGCFHIFVEELYEGPQVTDCLRERLSSWGRGRGAVCVVGCFAVVIVDDDDAGTDYRSFLPRVHTPLSNVNELAAAPGGRRSICAARLGGGGGHGHRRHPPHDLRACVIAHTRACPRPPTHPTQPPSTHNQPHTPPKKKNRPK